MNAHPFNLHNPLYAVIQAAAAQHFRSQNKSTGSFTPHPHMETLNKVLVKMDAGEELQGASDYENCLKLLVEYCTAVLKGDWKTAREKKNEYEYAICDVGWFSAIGEWIWHYKILRENPKYVTYNNIQDFQYNLPPASGSKLKVGMIADWGTGEQVAVMVLEALFEQEVDVIFHLGDIYYAGTPTEAQHNFLDIINRCRKKYDRQIPVYNLPGNHDYYSGGHGFYSINPLLNHGIANSSCQEASFWSVANEHWHFQGMDTGFYDSDLLKVGSDITHLHSTEVAWHQNKIEQARAAGKKVILLSHHQYFSSLLNIGKKPKNNDNTTDPNRNPFFEGYFNSYIQNKDITAWFWGHEHLLEIYDSYLGLDKGRCIGYGAFPALYDDGDPYKVNYPKVPLNTDKILDNNGEVYAHGFVVLDLGDSSGTVSYYSIPGDGSSADLKTIYTETI